MNSQLPGSQRCSRCTEIILEKDIRNHILNCRLVSSNDKQLCSSCNESFDKSQYEEHIQKCNQIKKCPICEKFVQDLSTHYETCELDEEKDTANYQTPRGQTPIQTEEIILEENINSNQKLCILCSKYINENELENHILNCSQNEEIPEEKSLSFDNNQISPEQLINSLKTCILCSNSINEIDFANHVTSCSNNDQENDVSSQGKKQCILCFAYINETDFIDHVTNCSTNQLETNQIEPRINIETKKDCILCFKSIDESEYLDHVTNCSSDQVSKNENSKKKDCILCFKPIDESEYINHVTNCVPNSNDEHQSNEISQNQNKTTCCASSIEIKPKRKDCILCFKSIHESEYENHVLSCVAQVDEKSNRKCFSCYRLKENSKDLFYTISCDHNHEYCFICLKESMEEFARNREKPVCHKSKCDYELSRHDVSLIPLERRLSDRLLKLVQGKQRPFCSKCKFYINLNENEIFDDHDEQCNELIPCEYCLLPYSTNQLDNHSKQCRTNQISFNEKLIDFISLRTKYPFTKEQIRFFIQQQNKSSPLSNDPHSIIQTLAVYGSIFPYDLPRRDCDICMEACPYDDIYVFDCPDSHKLCYKCYYQSCQTKMSNGEILTCALCTNVLKESELNQLRISKEELDQIQEYQIKKTFDIYSSRTRGIIKCPKQNCTWIAEAADPNERFKVQCPLCQHEFCSLCNQQYHYRTTCQQLPQITQRWFFWCQNERERYLRMRVEQDTTYQSQLNEYNQQRNENENRNRDLRRRYDELMHDEQYKAQNCRFCPSCKRVVQRLEGCDAMVCGQDAHGGNVQSGCGHKFNWQQAKQYQPSTTKQPKQKIIDLPQPENPIVHHNGVTCDHCKNDVNGIRFDCVHCPSLTFCEKCEQQSTLEHSQENQFLELQQHVFKLIMTPEEEAFHF